MPTAKKFGTFEGVFTPSILTILGVIMYMRLGWVVGHAGLWGTIGIIMIAHVISVSTGLCISSIATDKKIKVGGIYFMLSRSLGLPIGGALGITLFAGTAFSIALYLIGFAESFNAFMGWETGINDLRVTGSLSLVALLILVFISTSFALKVQFLILGAIGLSLVSIFMASHDFAPESVPLLPASGSLSLELVFAVFFPAVTGFTAGVAMSGDLKDPRKTIPMGTLTAIATGMIVYLSLAVFLAFMVDPETLRTDFNILYKIAWSAPLVVAGVWGATLSSALGGILGAPRILQALSADRITPSFFGKGFGMNNEPRNALLLTFLIAEAGILIGELNVIARVVTMFYLTAYCFINLSCLLESWASSDFRPSFKIPNWVGAIGFLATFMVMFKLDLLAMIVAFAIIGGIFLFLTRKQLSVVNGDVWQSVWSSVVKKGLEEMDKKVLHQRNWRPNILLFSGALHQRPFLIKFSRWLAGNQGLISNFELIETDSDSVMISKMEQAPIKHISDGKGVFGRRLACDNIYQGVENIARIYGFSGVEPNTVLMGWARNSEDPHQFAHLTRKLNHLDYNVLFLDYDKERGFGGKKQIDLWWRGAGNNAYLTLSLVRFMLISHAWRKAALRILIVDNTGQDHQDMVQEARSMVESFRLHAVIKVIDNAGAKNRFYDIIQKESAGADLTLLGIPEVIEGKEASFVDRTNSLLDVLGTTLLVKASSYFEEATIAEKEDELIRRD